MTAPVVLTELYIPTLGWKNVSAATSMDSSLEITERIESPAETNAFVAPDVTLKLLQDGTGTFLFSYFNALLPESTDFLVRISLNATVIFYGFVLPNTVQFNDAEHWCSFTAVGMAGKLARTSAEDDAVALKRYANPNWRVYSAEGNESLGVVTIYNTYGAFDDCEIVAGDTVTVTTPGGASDELKVIGCAPTTDAAPYAYFELTVAGLKQTYEAGSSVLLITPFERNVSVQHAIDRLLIGSGLNPTSSATFLTTPLSGATAPFATPPSMQYILGSPLGLSTYVSDILTGTWPGAYPMCGTNLGLWRQENPPTGGWEFENYANTAIYPVDWRPWGSGKWLQFGRRYQRVGVRSGPAPAPVTSYIYKFWCYDYSSTFAPVTYYRYRLEVEVDNADKTLGTYTWTTRLYQESSGDGINWTTSGGPYGAKTGTTSTDLHYEVPLTCGIDMIRALGVSTRIYFTEPDDGTDPCGYWISQMTVPAMTVTHNVGPGGQAIRGNVFRHGGDPNEFIVVRRDTLRGDVPMAFTLVDEGFSLSLLNSAPIPADMQPFTVKFNAGDGFWYALAASREAGVRLLSFVGTTLGVRAGWVTPSLFPPSATIQNADLTVINGTAGTTYPMMAIYGNRLWWISRASSGWIEYADFEGLSCGEAIAQLCILSDAYAYVDAGLVSWVKSRGTITGQSVTTGTAFSSTRLDDETCLTLQRASIWYKAYRYVTVRHTSDESIIGTAGDINFRGSEQALELESRFITTASFAAALAQHLLSYLGRALTVLDLTRLADGRRCGIGRWFTASINGVVKTFQIIDTTPRPLAGKQRVQAIEL